MSSQIFWHLARASGVVAWGLLSASVIWGLLLSTRVLQGRPRPVWLLDLHRFLGGVAVVFTGVHLVALLLDDYIEFGVADLLVPFASSWRPAAVALGVVAFYLLIAVELTSLSMRRIPRRWWKAVHMTSFGLFWIATWHLLAAGSDATHPMLFTATVLVSSTVVFLTAFRMLADRRSRRPSGRSAPTAVGEPSSSPRARGVPLDRSVRWPENRSHRTEVAAVRPDRR